MVPETKKPLVHMAVLNRIDPMDTCDGTVETYEVTKIRAELGKYTFLPHALWPVKSEIKKKKSEKWM